MQLNAQPSPPFIFSGDGILPEGYYFTGIYDLHKGVSPKRSQLMVLDRNGEVVLYKNVPLSADFKMHRDGRMSYYAGNKYYILNASFTLIDSVWCKNNIKTDSHDFVILPNGHYLLIGKEEERRDCSGLSLFMRKGLAGSRNTMVRHSIIQELDENKEVVFQWSSKKLYRLEDADPYYLDDTLNIDAAHFNSVDMDRDGSILVSVRYFNEVLKIRRSDSSVIWRMGGRMNQVRFENGQQPFLGQHDARFSGANRFTLFDNGFAADPLQHHARALEYEVDDAAKTATLVWSHSNTVEIVSEATGNVQRLAGGSSLVCYGKVAGFKTSLAFEMLGTGGERTMRANYRDTLGTYRVFFYPVSELKPEAPAVKRLLVNGRARLSTVKKHRYYLWSTGAKTAEIAADKPGCYFVYVSGDGSTWKRSDPEIIEGKK